MRAWTKQASPTYEAEPRANLRLWATLLPGRRQSYRCRPIQKREHFRTWRRSKCRSLRRISTHGLLLSMLAYRPFSYELTLRRLDSWRLHDCCIGIPQHRRFERLSPATWAFERSFCFHLDLLGQEKQPRLPVHHPCLHSIPDVAVPRARTCFSSNSRELAGYPFTLASIVATLHCGLASFFSFVIHSHSDLSTTLKS